MTSRTVGVSVLLTGTRKNIWPRSAQLLGPNTNSAQWCLAVPLLGDTPVTTQRLLQCQGVQSLHSHTSQLSGAKKYI